MTVDTGMADRALVGHNLKATLSDLEKKMREAAANLDFETAARLRDEIKRLNQVELTIGDDPLARQQAVEDRAGAYAGTQKYGAAANTPASRPHKPTDEDMGPHNFGGGEAKPRSTGGRGGMHGGKARPQRGKR